MQSILVGIRSGQADMLEPLSTPFFFGEKRPTWQLTRRHEAVHTQASGSAHRFFVAGRAFGIAASHGICAPYFTGEPPSLGPRRGPLLSRNYGSRLCGSLRRPFRHRLPCSRLSRNDLLRCGLLSGGLFRFRSFSAFRRPAFPKRRHDGRFASRRELPLFLRGLRHSWLRLTFDLRPSCFLGRCDTSAAMTLILRRLHLMG